MGGYEIVGRVGAGGMGIVYLARSPGGRRAALKVVRAEIADDPEFRDRFRREIGAARQVGGAFTAPVLDADPDAAQPWLATVFVEGPSLRDRVAEEGPLSERQARQLGAGLAEALRDMHRVGLVHRDVKPGNVLLAADGPRLIDFGIIRSDALADLTASGYVLGSAGFMAPEQAEGLHTGPAADVFALGAVLTFAVTGVGPFGSGPAATLLVRTVAGESDLSRVPEGLRQVVTRCLAQDPADRPADGEVLALLAGPAGPLVPVPKHWPGTSANPEPDGAPLPRSGGRLPAGPGLSRRKLLARLSYGGLGFAFLGSFIVEDVRNHAAHSRKTAGSDPVLAPSAEPSLPPDKTPLWDQVIDARVASPDDGYILALGPRPDTLFLAGRGFSALDPATGGAKWTVDGTMLDDAPVADMSVAVTADGAPVRMTPGSLIELSGANGTVAQRRGISPRSGDRILGMAQDVCVCDVGHASTTVTDGPPGIVGITWNQQGAVWTASPDAKQVSYAVAIGPVGEVAVADFGAGALTVYAGTNGRQLWRVGMPSSTLPPSAAFVGHDVVHGGRTVRRFNAPDAALAWEASSIGPQPWLGYRVLAVDADHVYVTSATPLAETAVSISALNVDDGSLHWTSSPVAIDLGSATPAVAGGGLVAVTDRGLRLTALDSTDGTTRWTRSRGAGSDGLAGLATDGVRVYWAAVGRVMAFEI